MAPRDPLWSWGRRVPCANNRAFRTGTPRRTGLSSCFRSRRWGQDSPAKSLHASPDQLRILRITKFAHHEFVVTSLGDSPGSLGPTSARWTRGPAQHKCTVLDRHFRSHLAVQTQLRKYRLGDDNSLGVAYLSNAYVYSPHSNNNVIPARLAVSGRRGTSGTSHSCRQPRNRLNEKIRGSHDGERLSTTSPVAYFSRTPSYSAAIGTRQSIPVNSQSASRPRVSLIRQNPASSRV